MDDVRGDFLGPPRGTTPKAALHRNFVEVYYVVLNIVYDFSHKSLDSIAVLLYFT